jgi:phosphoadenosine phosphosulfate reductase
VAELAANAKKMAQVLKNEPVLLFFSCGKDSIVSTNLFFTHYSGKKIVVFLYFVEGLEIKERVLRYYSKKWNAEIIQRPSYETLNLMQDKRKYKMSDIERGIRKEFDVSWIVQGIRKDESLARRGMLAHLPDGIDERNKKLYPISEWSAKTVLAYCRINKLLLPIEYQHGLKHDFYIPDAGLLIYLKNNFRSDYDKVISTFPQLKTIVWKEENGSK